MYKTEGLLMLSLLATIKVTIAGEPKFAFPNTVLEEDINSLLPITPEEALPLVLFESKTKTKLQNAVALAVAEITDGRLTSETKFYTRHSSEEIFFCPNPDKPKKCLDPKKFEKLQPLECEHEPIPTFEPNPNGIPCGPAGTGLELIFGYEICPAQEVGKYFFLTRKSFDRVQNRISYFSFKPYRYEMEKLVVYSICYDASAQKILFTDHMITSSGLLSEKLLVREREIKFQQREEIYDHIPYEYFVKFRDQAKPKLQYYTLQRLVPTDDMAFATARKLTENYANIALQHEDLFELWNQIRDDIRAHAVQSFDEPLIMMTGVFDIPEDDLSTSIEEQEIANIWVILIIDLTINSSKGMAILMNNFITEDTGYIDKICGKDFCVGSLKQKADEVGGQVRCCQVTESISKLFMAEKDILPIKEQLKILNINSTMNGITKFLNLFKRK